RSSRLAVLTASAFGCGIRGFPWITRSIHTHANSFALSLLRTKNAKRPLTSSAPGNDRAIRRTSACVAMSDGLHWVARVGTSAGGDLLDAAGDAGPGEQTRKECGGAEGRLLPGECQVFAATAG